MGDLSCVSRQHEDGMQGQPDIFMPYQKLYIYHTKFCFLIVGYCRVRKRYALLEIIRQDGQSLQARECVCSCSLGEVNTILRQAHVDTQDVGGLQFVTKAYGIIGCIRFTSGFYLLIVTRKAHMGSIRGHKVYRVDGVALLPLGAAAGVSQQQDTPEERRYRKLLMGVDLTKGFYFSFTYHLAATLQCNYQAGLAGAFAAAAATSPQPGRSGRGAGFASSAFSSADFDSMFVWNSFLTRTLRNALNSNLWVVALVHGFWDQRQLSVFGRPITLTLLARRSRHFAGTRFKKRGINDQGKVANEVETEQILDAGVDYRTGLPLISSLVQLRGSVPLYWSQQTSALSPKPEIILQNFDPMFEATALHFADLRARYGDPLIVLNLLKSHERKPREKLLRQELAAAIQLLNSKAPEHQRAVYIPWDFQQHAKQAGAGLLNEISAITRMSLDATGLFVHSPQKIHSDTCACAASVLGITGLGRDSSCSSSSLRCLSGVPGLGGAPAHSTAALVTPGLRTPHMLQAVGSSRCSTAHMDAGVGAGGPDSQGAPAPPPASTWPPFCGFQHGVLRTNCIDCLDRTNVAQFAFGLAGFGRQLFMLGLSDAADIDSDSSIAFMLMEQYELMGNTLALQYGGSDAHSVFFQRQKGEWEASTRGKDFLTSVRRFYSNAYTDADKQDAINLFLGNYVPGLPGQPELWELESDVYLHTAGRGSDEGLHSQTCMPAAPAVEVHAAAAATAAVAACGGDQGAVQRTAAGGVPCLGGSWNLGRSTLPALAHVSSDEDSPTAASASERHHSLFDPSSFFRPGGDDDEACGTLSNRPSASGSTSSGMRLPKGISSSGGSGGGWGISSILASLFKPQPGPPLGVPNFQDDAHTLVAFDTLLSQPCRRACPVRIHGTRSGQGSNLMWQAVQQAFAFYWTRQAVEEAAGSGGADSAQLQAAQRPSGPPNSALSAPPKGHPSMHRSSSGVLLGGAGAADGEDPSGRGKLRRSGSSSVGAVGVAKSAVEALMLLGQRLEAADADPATQGPRASANARALDQLSHPHPLPLRSLAAARQQGQGGAAPQPLLPHIAAALVPPPPASAARLAVPLPGYRRAAGQADGGALSPASSVASSPSMATPPMPIAFAGPSAKHEAAARQAHLGLLPPSPTPRLTPPATTPLGSPASAAPDPRYPAYPPHAACLQGGALSASLSNTAASGFPSHPYLLPPPPLHHSASSSRPGGVAPSPSVFTEGLWATWPAPCFSRGVRGSGAGNNSRRSQVDPWPAAPGAGAAGGQGQGAEADAPRLGNTAAGSSRALHTSGAATGSAWGLPSSRLYGLHAPQVLPLEQCTRPQAQPQPMQPRRGGNSSSALEVGQAGARPPSGGSLGKGRPKGGSGPTGKDDTAQVGREHAHQGSDGGGGEGAGGLQGAVPKTPDLGGRCDSAKQLEGSGSDCGEPCPGGLFSDGTALFLRDLRSAGGSCGGPGEAVLEDHCFLGYGGLMPEARSWADMWYSMFAGGTITQELNALFGASAPLNGFQPYRGGCVGVAGSPLPPTAAAFERRRHRARAQQRLLPLVPRASTRHKAAQRTLTPITRFGTTQYGTIAPAPDSIKEAVLLDDEVDGLGPSSWELEETVVDGGVAGTHGSADPEAAALALLQQLQGNTQKFRMIKRTPSGGFAGVEEVDARALKQSHVSTMLEASHKLAPNRIIEAFSGSAARAKPSTDAVSHLNDFIDVGPSAQQHMSSQAAASAAAAAAGSSGPGALAAAVHAASNQGPKAKETGRSGVAANEGAPGADGGREDGARGADILKGFSGGTHARQAPPATPSVVARMLRPPGSKIMPKRPAHLVANTPLGLGPAIVPVNAAAPSSATAPAATAAPANAAAGARPAQQLRVPNDPPAAAYASSSSLPAQGGSAATGTPAGYVQSSAGARGDSGTDAAAEGPGGKAGGPQLHRVLTRGADRVEAAGPEGEEDEDDDRGLGFRLNRSLGGFIASGVSLAGLLLDELHDCGLQWDCCPWWIAKQEELQAHGHPKPSRASSYQAALLHSMVKDQGVKDDYLNYYACMGRLLTEAQYQRLRDYYSFHAPVCTMPLKKLAALVSTW